jgi:5-methylcytosine-specific restriction endonuclease McrA
VCDSAVLPHPAHHIYPVIGLSPGTLPHLAHPCATGTSGHPANGISYAIKIQGAANPYDPAWEEYVDHRLGLQWLRRERREPLVTLWKTQNGRCPVCHQKITRETGWQLHHIRYRVHGGGDHPTNRALLHPNCHRQVHSQGLTVVKPGSARDLGEA